MAARDIMAARELDVQMFTIQVPGRGFHFLFAGIVAHNTPPNLLELLLYGNKVHAQDIKIYMDTCISSSRCYTIEDGREIDVISADDNTEQPITKIIQEALAITN